MLKRTITGAVITLIVYTIIAFSHIPSVILCAMAILSAFAVYEIYGAASAVHDPWMLWGSVAAAMVISMLPVQNYDAVIMVIFPLSIILFGWMMLRQKSCRIDKQYKAAGIAFLTVLLFKAIPELRNIQNGLYYLAGAVTLCFVTDVAAYLVGSRFGKHKLLPKVSPNKTIEGSAAGIIASVLFMLLYGFLMGHGQIVQVNYLLLGLYAVIASIVGQFGDLAMSAVKRICGIKDFGNLFPGHGGILDRFDSHMFCIPFTLLFCSLTGGFIL